jgi:hypothetical protein
MVRIFRRVNMGKMSLGNWLKIRKDKIKIEIVVEKCEYG